MTCTRNDEALALYVEGDLTQAETRVIEAHLAECARCRDLLHDLTLSQGALKALAVVDGVDDRALAAVRSRALSTLDERGRRNRAWRARSLRWLVAASLLAGAWALWHARTAGPHTNTKVADVPSTPAPGPGRVGVEPAPAAEAAPKLRVASTPSHQPRVSVHRNVGQTPAFGLSEEDADQLARAVVALARVDQVPVYAPAVAESPLERTPLVRVASDDPDVVIYWQLDSNGG